MNSTLPARFIWMLLAFLCAGRDIRRASALEVGDVSTVASAIARRQVFNLEVLSSHAYGVTATGLVSHNLSDSEPHPYDIDEVLRSIRDAVRSGVLDLPSWVRRQTEYLGVTREDLRTLILSIESGAESRVMRSQKSGDQNTYEFWKRYEELPLYLRFERNKKDAWALYGFAEDGTPSDTKHNVHPRVIARIRKAIGQNQLRLTYAAQKASSEQLGLAPDKLVDLVAKLDVDDCVRTALRESDVVYQFETSDPEKKVRVRMGIKFKSHMAFVLYFSSEPI